jgi:hypothetical protein
MDLQPLGGRLPCFHVHTSPYGCHHCAASMLRTPGRRLPRPGRGGKSRCFSSLPTLILSCRSFLHAFRLLEWLGHSLRKLPDLAGIPERFCGTPRGGGYPTATRGQPEAYVEGMDIRVSAYGPVRNCEVSIRASRATWTRPVHPIIIAGESAVAKPRVQVYG